MPKTPSLERRPVWHHPTPPPGETARPLWARPARVRGEPRHPAWDRPDPRPHWFRRVHRGHPVVVGLVLAVLVAALVLTALGGGGDGFGAQVTAVTPAGPDQVAVTVMVTNGRDVPATPTCQIQLSSSAYMAGMEGATGSVEFPVSLPAHTTRTVVKFVPVPAGRAVSVAAGSTSVSCR